eukprot:06237_1
MGMPQRHPRIWMRKESRCKRIKSLLSSMRNKSFSQNPAIQDSSQSLLSPARTRTRYLTTPQRRRKGYLPTSSSSSESRGEQMISSKIFLAHRVARTSSWPLISSLLKSKQSKFPSSWRRYRILRFCEISQKRCHLLLRRHRRKMTTQVV